MTYYFKVTEGREYEDSPSAKEAESEARAFDRENARIYRAERSRRKQNPRDMAHYRIITADRKIKFAGTDHPSWLTLDKAKKLVDYSKGEMIYQYDEEGWSLWEVL